LTVDALAGRVMKNVDLPEHEQELTDDRVAHNLPIITSQFVIGFRVSAIFTISLCRHSEVELVPGPDRSAADHCHHSSCRVFYYHARRTRPLVHSA
jgi:hypothetical protein